MINRGFLSSWPNALKSLVALFLLVLSIGFYTGIGFVRHTTYARPQGIQDQYLGNENDTGANIMRFKKSEHEMFNLLHTHFLSLSVIFFILGILTYGSKLPVVLQNFLMWEPLVSVVLTFGGLYFLWLGMHYMVYVVMISGFLMTISYSISILAIVLSLFKKNL